MQSVTTLNKQTKQNEKCEKSRPQLVINSLHFNNGELEACSRSTKTGVESYQFFFLSNFSVLLLNKYCEFQK